MTSGPDICQAFLERFQAGIVGIVGFLGVIVTLIVNAWIARSRDRDARNHERRSLSRALLAELRSYRQSVAGSVEGLAKDDLADGDLLIPSTGPTPVFDAYVGKLGLLDSETVSPVVNAYTVLKEFDRVLVLFSGPSDNNLFRGVERKRLEAVKRLFGGMVPTLDAAIVALEREVQPRD